MASRSGLVLSMDILPKRRRRDTADSLEIDRIVALPTLELPDPATIEVVSREIVQAADFDRGFRLNECQVGAILAYDQYDGLFGPIGVGRGKTYITLLIAERAFRRGESRRSLLLVPPNLIPQLLNGQVPAARRLFGLRAPVLTFVGRDRQSRLALARSGKRGLYVSTYSLLSSRDAEETLNELAPDLIVCDEAHRVKNADAARTKRLTRYLAKQGSACRLVALSGTITSKSIRDYHHLISHALGDRSPLPRSEVLVDGWAAALDSGAEPTHSQTGPIEPLVAWARREFPSESRALTEDLCGFRAAYRLRLNSAPGVVASGDQDLGTSLVLRNAPVPSPEKAEGHQELRRLQRQVQELWISPSGDVIEHGMHKWRHLYELASGFYYSLRWPTAAEIVEHRDATAEEAEGLLAQALRHHEERQLYHKALRIWIERRGRPGLDTPLLVGSDMARHGADNVGRELFAAWSKMKDLESPDLPERVSEPKRVCPWKVEHVARQAVRLRDEAEGRDGVLVWYWHHEVGRWLVEELKRLEADPLWCPADAVRPGSSARLLDPSSAERIVVVSIGGHSEGKNLQGEGAHPGFELQVLAEFPRRADSLEQLLGRTHRTGQRAEELEPITVNTDEFDHQNVSACLIDALYVHQTTGSRQKAIYCGWDPLPRVYPSDFLRERGFADVARLDPAARAALEDKFGPMIPGHGSTAG